jgi:DNA processing protein
MGVSLLAVPGSVFSRVSVGTNGLIKSGKARPVSSAEDILKEMKLSAGQVSLFGGSAKGGQVMSPILRALESGERSADELSRILKKPVSKVAEELLSLQLEGAIEEKAGKYGRVI